MPIRNVNLIADQDALIETALRAGIDALDRGDLIEIDDAELDATLDSLVAVDARDPM